MRPHILNPYTVTMNRGLITISISTIMASDKTTAIDRGLLLLMQENDLPNMSGWEAKATLNE
jgi:hypothetical protein